MLEPNQYCINEDKSWLIKFENKDNFDFAWTFRTTFNDGDLETEEYQIILGMTYDIDQGVLLNDNFAELSYFDESGNQVKHVKLDLSDKRNFPSLKLAFIAQINKYYNDNWQELDACFEAFLRHDKAA